MEKIIAKPQIISFNDTLCPADINVQFTACRIGPDGYLIDIVDFTRKNITRWNLPCVRMDEALAFLKQNLPRERVPFDTTHEDYYQNYLLNLHIAQLSSQGMLFVCMGDFTNGLCALAVDTRSGAMSMLPHDHNGPLMLYNSTGDFTADGKYWMGIRWPMEDSIDILCNRRLRARCEIFGIRLAGVSLHDLATKPLYCLENTDDIHQITCSPDNTHAVFASFKWDNQRPRDEVTTVDFAQQKHWSTPVPCAVPAHCEFDPLDPAVFYLSCHNFRVVKGVVILKGPASLIKMRIKNGETVIEGNYSDGQFFRLSQHMPFLYNGRVLIAVTNLPNKLDLIDGRTMTLWRRVELCEAADIDHATFDQAACPVYPGSCFAINSGIDGKYIVLESSQEFLIYDVARDRLLDVRINRHIPNGYKSTGHTRTIGR